MTLVISSYSFTEDLGFSRIKDPKNHLNIPSGTFVIADSVITHPKMKGSRLATSFRKTYEIDIKVYRPYLRTHGILGNFDRLATTQTCLVSMAGSTLVAQHALNLISSHLGNMRYVFDIRDKKYKIIRSCEENPMLAHGYVEWDESTFSDDDIQGLLSADLIHKTVLFSIDHIVNSVARARLGETSKISTEFLLNVQCPTTKEHIIYQYTMDQGGPKGIEIIHNKIDRGDIGVIGMRDLFYSRAKDVYRNCLEQQLDPQPALIDLLKSAIPEVHSSGSFEIDYPISLKKIGKHKLEKMIIPAPSQDNYGTIE